MVRCGEGVFVMVRCTDTPRLKGWDSSAPISVIGIRITTLLYPASRFGALSDDARLTSVCLTSVAYIGAKSRTERPRKTTIGIEVAHVTRDSDTMHF